LVDILLATSKRIIMAKVKMVAFYPVWTGAAMPLGAGAAGGALVSFLTAHGNAMLFEGAIFIIAGTIALTATYVRHECRERAREEFAKTGGDPADLHFL
jgi:hypothetical protein